MARACPAGAPLPLHYVKLSLPGSGLRISTCLAQAAALVALPSGPQFVPASSHQVCSRWQTCMKTLCMRRACHASPPPHPRLLGPELRLCCPDLRLCRLVLRSLQLLLLLLLVQRGPLPALQVLPRCNKVYGKGPGRLVVQDGKLQQGAQNAGVVRPGISRQCERAPCAPMALTSAGLRDSASLSLCEHTLASKHLNKV